METTFNRVTVFLFLACSSHCFAQVISDCAPAFSFVQGAYTYHVIIDCVGSSSRASDGCQAMNGSLALPRSEVVVKTIGNFVFQEVHKTTTPTPEETTTTPDPLVDSAENSHVVCTQAPESTGGGETIETPPPQIANSGSESEPNSGSSSSDSSSSDSSSSGSGSSRRKRSAEICVVVEGSTTPSPCVGSNCAKTDSLHVSTTPAYREPATYTYWTAPFITLPELDTLADRKGTCGFISFRENRIGNFPEVQMNLTNACNDSRLTFPWICETQAENYKLEKADAVPKRRPEQTVMDYRPSAVLLGSSGVIIVGTFAAIVVILDISQLIDSVRQFYKKKSNKDKSWTYSPTKTQGSGSTTDVTEWSSGSTFSLSGWTEGTGSVMDRKEEIV